MNENVQLNLFQPSKNDMAYSIEFNINFVGIRREPYEI